jgi:collagen type III alpha
MSIMLPGDLAWVLNLLGFAWPNVDEDQLRAAAADHRRMAERVEQVASRGGNGAGTVARANEGKAVQAFASRWGQVSESHLGRLAQVYGITADVQDVMADIVEGAKVAVIAQLAVLAGEIAAAAAASVVTFGLSDAAGLAATALTRITVREILDELERQLVSAAGQVLAGEAFQALSASVASLLAQGVADYVGTGHGFSVSQAAGAGAQAAEQGAAWLSSGRGASQIASGTGATTAAGLAGRGEE